MAICFSIYNNLFVRCACSPSSPSLRTHIILAQSQILNTLRQKGCVALEHSVLWKVLYVILVAVLRRTLVDRSETTSCIVIVRTYTSLTDSASQKWQNEQDMHCRVALCCNEPFVVFIAKLSLAHTACEHAYNSLLETCIYSGA